LDNAVWNENRAVPVHVAAKPKKQRRAGADIEPDGREYRGGLLPCECGFRNCAGCGGPMGAVVTAPVCGAKLAGARLWNWSPRNPATLPSFDWLWPEQKKKGSPAGVDPARVRKAQRPLWHLGI